MHETEANVDVSSTVAEFEFGFIEEVDVHNVKSSCPAASRAACSLPSSCLIHSPSSIPTGIGNVCRVPNDRYGYGFLKSGADVVLNTCAHMRSWPSTAGLCSKRLIVIRRSSLKSDGCRPSRVNRYVG